MLVKATYTVVIDRELDGRVIASVPGLPGCHAYGRTPSEAVRRVKGAVRFYLRETIGPRMLARILKDVRIDPGEMRDRL